MAQFIVCFDLALQLKALWTSQRSAQGCHVDCVLKWEVMCCGRDRIIKMHPFFLGEKCLTYMLTGDF